MAEPSAPAAPLHPTRLDAGAELHEVVWTPSKIARFWNHFAGIAAHHDSYFCREVGASLLRVARRGGVALDARVLDFGCGVGHLLELLVAQGGSCSGVDYSAASVAEAQRRLAGKPGLARVVCIESLPTPFAAGEFDVVFLVETIEHLLPDALEATLREIRRVLRRGGKLVVTTPNQENLLLQQVACPDCGGVFHRMQHLSSWSAASLEDLLAKYGFGALSCRGERLARPGLLGAGVNLARKLVQPARPHLIYIGQKTRGD